MFGPTDTFVVGRDVGNIRRVQVGAGLDAAGVSGTGGARPHPSAGLIRLPAPLIPALQGWRRVRNDQAVIVKFTEVDGAVILCWRRFVSWWIPFAFRLTSRLLFLAVIGDITQHMTCDALRHWGCTVAAGACILKNENVEYCNYHYVKMVWVYLLVLQY